MGDIVINFLTLMNKLGFRIGYNIEYIYEPIKTLGSLEVTEYIECDTVIKICRL
jgi:hypothetical protein